MAVVLGGGGERSDGEITEGGRGDGEITERGGGRGRALPLSTRAAVWRLQPYLRLRRYRIAHSGGGAGSFKKVVVAPPSALPPRGTSLLPPPAPHRAAAVRSRQGRPWPRASPLQPARARARLPRLLPLSGGSLAYLPFRPDAPPTVHDRFPSRGRAAARSAAPRGGRHGGRGGGCGPRRRGRPDGGTAEVALSRRPRRDARVWLARLVQTQTSRLCLSFESRRRVRIVALFASGGLYLI